MGFRLTFGFILAAIWTWYTSGIGLEQPSISAFFFFGFGVFVLLGLQVVKRQSTGGNITILDVYFTGFFGVFFANFPFALLTDLHPQTQVLITNLWGWFTALTVLTVGFEFFIRYLYRGRFVQYPKWDFLRWHYTHWLLWSQLAWLALVEGVLKLYDVLHPLALHDLARGFSEDNWIWNLALNGPGIAKNIGELVVFMTASFTVVLATANFLSRSAKRSGPAENST